MLWFNLYENLFSRGSFRQGYLNINVLDWLAPVVTFSFAAIVGTYFPIDFLQRCGWFRDIVSLYSLNLLFLNNWLDLLSLRFVFRLLNLVLSCVLLLHFLNSCFQLCLFCVFLELIPTLCKSFTFRWELFLVLILVLLEKLVDLKSESLRVKDIFLRVLQQTLVGNPFCHQAPLHSKSQFCVVKTKKQILVGRGFRHLPTGRLSLASRQILLRELGLFVLTFLLN